MSKTPSSNATKTSELLEMTVEITSAYLGRNPIPPEHIPVILKSIYDALQGTDSAVPDAVENIPAVPIKKSVTPEHLLCLECGRELKMLKRHLTSAHGMSTKDYMTKWSLPPTYPLVAPLYAEKRSHLAHEIGLGHKSRKRNKKSSAQTENTSRDNTGGTDTEQ